MPIIAAAVGRRAAPRETYIDARWLMSYAAGIGAGDLNPMYFDTTSGPASAKPTNDFHRRGPQGAGNISHPVFPWAIEWPILLGGLGAFFTLGESGGERGPQLKEQGASIHYSEDIVIKRPFAAGDIVTTTACLASVEKTGKGIVSTIRFEHSDTSGDVICTTWNGSYSRGGDTECENRTLAELMPPPVPALPASAHPIVPMRSFNLPVSAVEAHVYSECSRIWNPIHTDKAAALAAGLPDIILHGTATLAKAVTLLIDEYAGSDPRCVRRVVAGGFSAVVQMPSTITVNVRAVEEADDGTSNVHYEVLN